MGVFDSIKQGAEELASRAQQAAEAVAETVKEKVAGTDADAADMPETSHAEHGLGVETPSHAEGTEAEAATAAVRTSGRHAAETPVDGPARMSVDDGSQLDDVQAQPAAAAGELSAAPAADELEAAPEREAIEAAPADRADRSEQASADAGSSAGAEAGFMPPIAAQRDEELKAELDAKAAEAAREVDEAEARLEAIRDELA
ncbi:hypothetical protein USB125703_01342 [Pseudoclavibacter triregionum]|nr:hypothetical protein USB125703_01342 [Pseudoclavibacter triregionum]